MYIYPQKTNMLTVDLLIRARILTQRPQKVPLKKNHKLLIINVLHINHKEVNKIVVSGNLSKAKA